MAEIIVCSNPNCQENINLEIDVWRDNDGNIYCSKCDTLIVIK